MHSISFASLDRTFRANAENAGEIWPEGPVLSPHRGTREVHVWPSKLRGGTKYPLCIGPIQKSTHET